MKKAKLYQIYTKITLSGVSSPQYKFQKKIIKTCHNNKMFAV